ncbi:MAG: EscU/YscU/HrcU family type III secretion system export apparatus switch protein [Pseudomonadota bacterium]
MSQDGKDAKIYPPSEKKIAEAKRKGNNIPAHELRSSIFLTIGGLFLIAIYKFGFFEKFINDLTRIFINFPEPSRHLSLESLAFGLQAVVWLFILQLFTIVISMLLSFSVMSFPIADLSKIHPKFQNLSVLRGISEKFNGLSLWKFVLSIFKVAICILFLISWLVGFLDRYGVGNLFPARFATDMLIEQVLYFCVFCALSFLGVAVLDYFVQRKVYLDSLRMTREEVREEQKQSEGNPEFRQHRIQKAKEIAGFAGREAVAQADVVLVNPTHIAVALVWDKQANSLPNVAAKGQGQLASLIRRIAEEENVPVVRDVATARSLYARCEVGEPIERQHFKAVAAAFRFIATLERGRNVSRP